MISEGEVFLILLKKTLQFFFSDNNLIILFFKFTFVPFDSKTSPNFVLPFCLLPILITLILKKASSIIPLDEFQINKSKKLNVDKYF